MASKIKLIVVGKVKEKYILEGVREFEKRLGPFCRFEVIELKDEGLLKESLKLEKFMGPDTFVLDALGAEYDSVEFSKFVKSHEKLTFVIGGHDGIDSKLKKQSIALSKMTFTHEMARFFLTEQIYRAFMIEKGRKYHK